MPSDRREPWVLAVAMLLPTIVTVAYFRLASAAPESVQQAVFVVCKLVQFSLPVVWVIGVLRHRPRWSVGRRSDAVLGVAFGLAVMLITWFGYAALADTGAMASAMTPIRLKVASLGIDDAWRFAAVGVFYSLVHSLFEEYYWRWFVYGRLVPWVGNLTAIVLSSFAFMLHHVVVLTTYFPHAPGVAAALCLCVAAGGAFWAWLYGRSGSLLGPWLGHLLVDAGIFAVGYKIAFVA